MPATIRTRLLLLVVSLLVPAALGVAWLVVQTYHSERSAHERTLRETARAVSLAVDRELASRQSIAKALALSRSLDDPDPTPAALAAFAARAGFALEGTGGWVELRDPTGRVRLDTRPDALPGRPGPALLDMPAVEPLRGLREGDVPHVMIVEPVRRDGRLLFNVAVALRATEMQALLDRLALPAGAIGTVMDQRQIVVARHPGGQRSTGRPVTPDLAERLRREPEALFESTSLDGVRVVGFYSTAPSGWTVITGMARERFAGTLPDAVQRIVLGALALLALAVVGALLVARSIVRPVLDLKDAAARMQAGEPVPVRATGIVECDEVARALAETAETVRHNRSDLERQVADAVDRTRQAEQRVSQSQRVEALGRLTGGVAHDFNNLLGVISNSAHLMQRHPAAGELQVPLAATLRAVEAGSQLTQHLLRFAGRQPLRPQRVWPARLLPEMQDLLVHVLGRRMRVSVDVQPDTAPVRVDAGELELALLNLALNARDAMPRGGEVRLAARNANAADREDTAGLDPGRRWVLITVGDDGVGIPPEIAEHVFEPFFTTKGVGQGSGLGLSQVHGFATQAGGSARIASAPGLGTTVSLWLPADGEAGSVPPPLAAGTGPAAPAPRRPRRVQSPAAQPQVQGLRVLLVEDNEALGDVTAALLESHGATVLRAASAGVALARLERGDAVDVVLSDVVMPGELDGLALARTLRERQPALPVLLTSGYSQAAAAAEAEFTVLRKPCPGEALLAALAGTRSATAGASPTPTGDAPMDRDDIVDTLNDLIENCKDGEYGFRTSAENLKSDEIRQLFLRRADDCLRGAQELQALVAAHGGTPDEGGSVSGSLHRGWVSVKGTLAGYSDEAILEEVERGEDAAVARYRKALEKGLPADVMAVVQRQYEGTQRNHDQVRALRDQAKLRAG